MNILEKRKGLEWFRLLNRDQRKRFKKNFIKAAMNDEPVDKWLNKVFTIGDFFSCCFCWSLTREGFGYWHKIYLRLINNNMRYIWDIS